MVVKELAASAYHVSRYFEQYSHARSLGMAYHSLLQSRQEVRPNLSGVISKLEVIQNGLFNYEQKNGFPFDGNPLLKALDVEIYMSAGAIENIKELLIVNPADAEKLLQVAENKVDIAHKIVNNLESALDDLPGYKSWTKMYATEKDRTLVRFVLADQDGTLSDSSHKAEELLNALKHLGKLNRDPQAYSFKIVALSHSSPEMILLAISVNGALALNFILKSVLARWKDVEEIKNIRAKTENIKADTELKKAKVTQILENLKELEEVDDEENRKLSKAVVSSFGGELDGERPEVERAIEETAKYIENLTVNGGMVSIYLQPGQLDNEEGTDISQMFIESRKMQSILEPPKKMLEQ